MICGCFVLSPTRARRGGTPHAVREWSDLGRRDIDGLACEGSRRVSGSERVNKTSPEPSTLLVKVLGFLYHLLEHGAAERACDAS